MMGSRDRNKWNGRKEWSEGELGRNGGVGWKEEIG